MSTADEYPWVRVRISPTRPGVAAIDRVGPLTPYLTQMVVEDALAWGQGATVQLEFRDRQTTGMTTPLSQFQHYVQLLAGRNVHLTVVPTSVPLTTLPK